MASSMKDHGKRGHRGTGLSLRAGELEEWDALAALLGRSRADLMREALLFAGLPYARGLASRYRTVQNERATHADERSHQGRHPS
jgi:hypothetical protein